MATVAVGAAVAIIGLALAGTQLGDNTSDDTSGSPVAGSSAPDGLAGLEAAVRERPDDATAWAALGAGYVDHARVNSDPSAYPEAERALDRSLALQPDGNSEALAVHGALAAGRHDFATALRYSEQALALQPQNSFVLGIMVDSLTELGRYPEAVAAAQTMVDLRPDLSSYARVSYQRELHGDIDGAIEAMFAAHNAAASPADKAFALYHLGELEWQRGALDAAESHYTAALRADPSAVQALAGLGRIAAAEGDLQTGIDNYERAIDAYPDPEALKELGELYLLNGEPVLAEDRFAQAAESNAAQAAGGVDVNLEIALISADHRRDLDVGLAAAQQEWDRRQSIHVADALAWQLHVNGRSGEALDYANKALELGTRNATFHFHRAEIHRALGHQDQARADYAAAIELNPHFSFVHATTAQAALAELGPA